MYLWAGVSVWMIGLIWKITVFYIGSVLIWAYNGYVALATLARTLHYIGWEISGIRLGFTPSRLGFTGRFRGDSHQAAEMDHRT